jgi:hypothetical protein
MDGTNPTEPQGMTSTTPAYRRFCSCWYAHAAFVIPYAILFSFARGYRMHLIFEKSGIRMYLTVFPILIRPG